MATKARAPACHGHKWANRPGEVQWYSAGKEGTAVSPKKPCLSQQVRPAKICEHTPLCLHAEPAAHAQHAQMAETSAATAENASSAVMPPRGQCNSTQSLSSGPACSLTVNHLQATEINLNRKLGLWIHGLRRQFHLTCSYNITKISSI